MQKETASVFEMKHNAVLHYQPTTNYPLQTVQLTEKIYVIYHIYHTKVKTYQSRPVK